MLGLGTTINRGGLVASESFLLDDYSGAAAAYSLRKLSGAYSGNAVKVRRASDNAELDIGFSGGELDTSAIATYCGSSDGFVSVWYDQSSNSNNATQTTAANQPKIYDGTTGVVTENGKPAVQFIYNDSKMFAGSVITDENVTLVGVATKTANGVYGLVSTQPNYNQGYELTEVSGFMSWRIFDSDLDVAVSATTPFITFAYYDGSTQGLSINGSHSSKSSTQSFSLTANLAIGVRLSSGGGQAWSGTIQEMVVYPSSQATNRTNIEDNVNTFYSIY